ncbi:hypothetical protein T440DRAFT_288566 [Plenodomus tracheiphilus IPT5]|uniref:Uncharacterized protein n=1 Tax=Plenodomus tracheiphilus IPT5 TaxID=1408161 RepID=A0A6A7BED8_9PLEO|nr:hypothetical protein T440DRAFT_288566 [Plenodomus tracheiphilus IPT5]
MVSTRTRLVWLGCWHPLCGPTAPHQAGTIADSAKIRPSRGRGYIYLAERAADVVSCGWLDDELSMAVWHSGPCVAVVVVECGVVVWKHIEIKPSARYGRQQARDGQPSQQHARIAELDRLPR